MRRKSIAILGGGAWGSVLAMITETAGCRPTIWMRDKSAADEIQNSRQTPRLPGLRFDEDIVVTADLGDAVQQARDAIVLAVPAQSIRKVVIAAAPHISAGVPLVLAAKGIEDGTGRLLSEIIAEILPQTPLAVMSGPGFAAEVAVGLPTAVTLACRDGRLARRIANLFMLPHFRPYLSTDPVAAEIGGALKNVMAIASGIIIGHGLGENARAALLTRGLAEMVRLGKAKGAKAASFAGLSGWGDLLLSATSEKSRNYVLGLAIGRGASMRQLHAERYTLAEGIHTAAAANLLAGTLNLDMPITAAVDAILHLEANIEDCMAALLARPVGME